MSRWLLLRVQASRVGPPQTERTRRMLGAQRGGRGFAALATDERARVFVDDTLLEFDAAVLEQEAAR